MDFANGAVGTIVTSFDVYPDPAFSPIVIYGTEGTLAVPDPNGFGGPVRFKGKRDKEFKEVPLTHGHNENSRGSEPPTSPTRFKPAGRTAPTATWATTSSKPCGPSTTLPIRARTMP